MKSPDGCTRQGFESANQTTTKGKPMNSVVKFDSKIQSMTSLEISELVEKRHDNVKRTIETLAEQQVITLPQIEEATFLNSIGRKQNTAVYVFTGEQGKLDSITVVAQLCPEFTARLVKRWYELEQQLIKTTIQAPKKPSELSSAFRSCMSIAKLCGLKGNQAILSADRATRKLTGESPLELLEITHLHAPVQEQVFTPTQIGEMLNPKLSGQKVNKLLAELCYQVKEGELWLMTEKGKSFGELMDTGKKHSNGTPVKQLKWYQSIVACLDMEKAE